jgi:membrane associated rhomboid family serine protease
MDLSLVLLSQDIEAMIVPPAEGHGWQLLVAPEQHPRALHMIATYRAENRRFRWQQEIPGSGLIFDWRSLVWQLVLIVFFTLSVTSQTYLRPAGVMDARAVQAGEWWRLFTAVTLHNDAAHLLANATTGALLLGLAMGAFGSGLALLGAYLAGAGGNLAGLLLYDHDYRGLGASGMVMGSLGMMAAQWLVLLRVGLTTVELAVRGAVAGGLLLVLLGFDPHTDVVAHVGGFVTGGLLGAGLAWFGPHCPQKPWLNRLAEIVCAAGVMATWAWALA